MGTFHVTSRAGGWRQQAAARLAGGLVSRCFVKSDPRRHP